MEIEIADALASVLLKKAGERGVAIDEYLLHLASVDLDVDERVELYLKLYEKYLREAEEYLEKGDIVQAGEKRTWKSSLIFSFCVVRPSSLLRGLSFRLRIPCRTFI
ncbi:MAG: Archaeal PaREP1/PaREP8 family protein [Candidatus Bathyarchaeota archaeon BA1]|nr:MAG: Archaeal PaREP1/PaREP8 family protein [Candidatus Bathyarchaeota archaeon BA1]